MNLKNKMILPAILILATVAAPAQVRRSTTTTGSTTSGQTVRRSTTTSGSATSSQPVRRSSDTEKATRQQVRVDQQQQPTNVSNQPRTNREVTQAAQEQRRNATSATSQQPVRRATTASPAQENRRQEPRRSTTRPQQGQSQPASGKGTQPSNHPGGKSVVVVKSSAPLPPRPTLHYYRPRPAPVPKLTPMDIRTRTNASQIVVYTDFTTREEAFNYLVNLLYDRYYDIASYRYFSRLSTAVTLIPTPSGWTRPDTHNEFRMYFHIGKCMGRIKVTVTAEWRESLLSGYFTGLRYQPSDQYSTYYAWNVLEDIAYAIPSTRVVFR